MKKMIRIEKLNRLSDILEESVAKQEIAGGNLCVIHKGREVYYAQAGYANIAEKKKMERNTFSTPLVVEKLFNVQHITAQ